MAGETRLEQDQRGIVAQLLGRLHPVGITFAGLLMGLIYMGGELAQIELGMPNAITGVFQGLLLFYLLACDVLIRYRFTQSNGGLLRLKVTHKSQ